MSGWTGAYYLSQGEQHNIEKKEGRGAKRDKTGGYWEGSGVRRDGEVQRDRPDLQESANGTPGHPANYNMVGQFDSWPTTKWALWLGDSHHCQIE